MSENLMRGLHPGRRRRSLRSILILIGDYLIQTQMELVIGLLHRAQLGVNGAHLF